MSLKEENQILKQVQVHDLMSSALEVICEENISPQIKEVAKSVFYSNLQYAELKTGCKLPELRKLYEKVLGF